MHPMSWALAPPWAFGAGGLRCALPGVGPGMGQLLSVLALTRRVHLSCCGRGIQIMCLCVKGPAGPGAQLTCLALLPVFGF